MATGIPHGTITGAGGPRRPGDSPRSAVRTTGRRLDGRARHHGGHRLSAGPGLAQPARRRWDLAKDPGVAAICDRYVMLHGTYAGTSGTVHVPRAERNPGCYPRTPLC